MTTTTAAEPTVPATARTDLRPRCMECGEPVDAMLDDFGAPTYSVRMNLPCRHTNAGLDFRHLAPTTPDQPGT